MFVKKPGKMRWNYKSPEEKVFVSDGRQIQLYVPADKQVMISPVPADDQATSAVLFLMGKGNLTRDFTVSYAEGAADTTYVLRLEPKTRQAEYDWLQVDGRPQVAADPRADGRRPAGRTVDVPVHELQGKHRSVR